MSDKVLQEVKLVLQASTWDAITELAGPERPRDWLAGQVEDLIAAMTAMSDAADEEE